MSLKYVLAERVGLKLQPQNGWRNMQVEHLSSSQLFQHSFSRSPIVIRRAQLYQSNIYAPVV